MQTHLFQLANGQTLAYNTYGNPTHYPVVFFHGFGASRNAVFAEEQKLEANGIYLISFDRPGVGGSDLLKGFTLTQVAEALNQLLHHVGITEVALMGWPGGGLPWRMQHISPVRSAK